jgi:hypothetical protein
MQMRFWLVALMVGALGGFALVFYWINKWSMVGTR